MKLICKKLNIELISFINSRFLKTYNKQLAFSSITRIIYLTLTINKYAKKICFILIVSLENYRIIIDKF